VVSVPVPQVSVIVVTRNSLPALNDCLKALPGAVADLSHELIIIDNASSDASVAEATRLGPSPQIIRNDKNIGFAAACNQGAEAAHGEYLLFLNPDVVLDHNAVAVLSAESQSHPTAGLVSGRLRNADNSFQATCRKFPTIGNLIFSRGSALSKIFGGSPSEGGRYTLGDAVHTMEVPAVAATLVLIRRDLFDKIGRFDRRFFMYMEDTDLSLRLHQHGRTNLFVPAAGGMHRWGEGSCEGRIRRLWWHHLSVWKYFLKHLPNGFSVVILPALLGINFLVSIVRPRRKVGERP
jgi:GT2 family glycosyltransferase